MPTKAELQAELERAYEARDRAQADRAFFANRWASVDDWRTRHAEEDRRYGQELADLRVIVRDQRRYIASLEDQLTPFLVRIVDGEQEALI